MNPRVVSTSSPVAKEITRCLWWWSTSVKLLEMGKGIKKPDRIFSRIKCRLLCLFVVVSLVVAISFQSWTPDHTTKYKVQSLRWIPLSPPPMTSTSKHFLNPNLSCRVPISQFLRSGSASPRKGLTAIWSELSNKPMMEFERASPVWAKSGHYESKKKSDEVG